MRTSTSARAGMAMTFVALVGVALPRGAVAANVVRLTPPGEPGQPMILHGQVLVDGAPAAGADLHVYQTDASGAYVPGQAMSGERNARLAATVTTDAEGRCELHTVRPGGYPQPVRVGGSERRIPAHVHVDVRVEGIAERRLQVVFADDPLLADPYWQDWVKRLGQPVVELRTEQGVATGGFAIRLSRGRN